MTTVTGLTAARMLQIEAESVVDGDVIGGNLILTKHDGTTINAGPVTGPQGPAGPVGQDLSVLSAVPILDVGLTNQIRAGRQLTRQDFTNLGLNPPIGLWNLSDLTDASGNARSLTNKGGVPFVPGINGVANTATKFVGNTAQALYISDTGINDPFRIRTGSIGAWFQSERGLDASEYEILAKGGQTAGTWAYHLYVGSGVLGTYCTMDGSAGIFTQSRSVVTDGRWHFGVVTYDGSVAKMYVDGVFEASVSLGLLFQTSSPLNIGARNADGVNPATVPFNGCIDEVFITGDVLTEDQIRNLYCAKIAHTLGAIPVRTALNIRRCRKGAAFTPADFPTQPLRLHNFSGGSWGDEGSNNISVFNNGGAAVVAGADGSLGNAFNFNGANQYLSSTDAGLPGGTSTRSYGAWFKTLKKSGCCIVAWGGGSNVAETRIGVSGPDGLLENANGNSSVQGPFVADGYWHFVVEVEELNPADGLKRKLYLDGKIVTWIAAVMNPITLSGADRFRIGALTDTVSSYVFDGQIDGVFVCNYALTSAQIAKLYAKSSQILKPSPKNPGDHIEAIDATNLYATFDALESQHQVDLAVA